MTDPERGEIRYQPGSLPPNPKSFVSCRRYVARGTGVAHQRTSGDLRLERGGRALLRICASAWTRGSAKAPPAEGLFAPPIRMLVGGAGEVHLVPFVSQIIELHDASPARVRARKACTASARSGEMGRSRRDRATPARRPRVHGGAPRVPSLARAGPVLRPRSIKPMSAFQLDVMRFPPSAQGRKIVAARRGQRERRIVLRLHEGTSASNSKNSTCKQDARSLHSLPEALGNGAEILADDQATVSTTFQGEDADQVIHEIGDVSAFEGAPLRDPIEMLEPHDMIDLEPPA